MAGDLNTLLEDGLIDEVLGLLKTGKEAEVWLVRHGEDVLAAKIYKERAVRSFKNNAGYKEGRQVRNTRTARAIARGSKFGREAEEDAWKSSEADALYKLRAQGVRVPEARAFYEGVLLMQLVTDAEGQPAPRLIDSHLTPEEAAAAYEDLRGQVVKMLCAEIIHGDLSPYNVLMGTEGPTIIDFPQVVGAAHNNLAEEFFRRDLDNLRNHFGAIDAQVAARASDAAEIWRAYVRRELTPDFVPTGRAPEPQQKQGRGPRPHGGAPRQHAPGPKQQPPHGHKAQHGQPHRAPHGQPQKPQHGGPQRPQHGAAQKPPGEAHEAWRQKPAHPQRQQRAHPQRPAPLGAPPQPNSVHRARPEQAREAQRPDEHRAPPRLHPSQRPHPPRQLQHEQRPHHPQRPAHPQGPQGQPPHPQRPHGQPPRLHGQAPRGAGPQQNAPHPRNARPRQQGPRPPPRAQPVVERVQRTLQPPPSRATPPLENAREPSPPPPRSPAPLASPEPKNPEGTPPAPRPAD